MSGMLPPIIVELKALSGEFTTKMGEAKGELAALDAEGKSHLSSLAKYGRIAAVSVATLAVGIGAMSVKLGVEFQESQAQLQGSAGLTAKQVKSIGDAMTGTAFKTTFTAQQMSAALAPVGGVLKHLAGGTLSAAAAMGFMRSAGDLAEASNMRLAATTRDLASVMNAFGLNTKQAGMASGELFNASRLTGIGLDQLTQTVVMLHGRLGITAPSLADTGALMVDLARHGVSGSRGVRVVQSALGTLLGGSKATGKALAALGVHLFNAQGKFIGMAGVIGQLSPKLRGLSDQQRLLTESVLFGKTASLAMNNTILAGVGAYDSAGRSVRNTGALLTAAGLAFKTLKGQLKTIAAGVEDLGTRLGGILVPMLSKLVGGLMDVATWLGKNKPVLAGVGLAIGTVLVPAIVAWAVSMGAAAVATVVAAAPIIAIGLLVGALGVGIVELWTHWRRVWGNIKGWTEAVWRPIQRVFHDIIQVGLYPIRMDIQILRDVWSAVWGQIKTAVSEAWRFIKPIFDMITRGIGDVTKGISTVTHLASSVGHGIGGVLGSAGKLLGFDAGGVVPGAVGSPMLAMVHGGEVIIPPGMIASPGRPPGGGLRGQAGGQPGASITVHVTGNTFLGGSPSDADHIAGFLAAGIQKHLYDRQNFGVPVLS